MKYNTIIIGGGLAGLVCGIKLQKAGRKCAIVSAGQSAMHFSSGTFELLDRLPDGTIVDNPIEAISKLPENHPYRIMGAETVAKYAEEAPKFFDSLGIKVSGSHEKNSWRITPTGERKASWLTLGDFTPLTSKEEKIGNKALIVNILGYLDFNTKFLADSFEKQGIECRIASIRLDEMERLRKNPSEMRATNIARVMDRENIWEKAAAKIKEMLKDEDVVVLPAVFGLKKCEVIDMLREAIGIKTVFIATMPPSVPGIRTQMALRSAFEKAGGTFILGDSVTDTNFDRNGHVESIVTHNFEDILMYADNFVIATGSFFSKGMIATPTKVFEPIFGLDLTFDSGREKWFDRNFWNKQNYISYGAKISKKLHPYIDEREINNLYVAGSLIGGSNTLFEGSGGGIAIVSALAVADNILDK